MTRVEITFTRFLRSQGSAVLMALAALFMICRAFSSGIVNDISDFRTIAFSTPGAWFGSGVFSLWMSILSLVLVAVLLAYINRRYNILRSASFFFCAYFLFTVACIPFEAVRFTGANLLALTLMGATWVLFSIYNRRISSRRVFIVFFLLGLGLLFEYCFLLYVPVFLLGMGQMKIFRFKKILAAGIGLITPAWIVWGLGLTDLPELPVLCFTPPSLLLSIPGGWPLLTATALTILSGIFFGVYNLLKIMAFNARSRAYNGFLAILSIATGLFALLNFTNIGFYLILLNACNAFSIGHFFRFTVKRRGYIPVLVLMIAFFGIYLWALSA